MTVLRIAATYDAVSDGATKTATGETLKVGLDGSTVYRAAIKFDVSGLPASTPDISRVELEVTVRAAGEQTGKWDVRPYHTNGAGDPSADVAADLYSRAATGTPYVNDSFLFRHTGRHRILLGAGTGATACTDLETAAAAAGNIFSLGLMEQGDDDDYCELEALDYADSDNPPELIVTYSDTATSLALLQELAYRIDSAHYKTGTLTTSSATVPADTARAEDDNWWEEYWLLLGAGTYIGVSRLIKLFANTGGVFTVSQAFAGVTGAVAYYLMPTSPVLMARALNAAAAELFPDYLYLRISVEMGVNASRHQFYDVPAGMAYVERVDYRYDGDDKEWYPVAFERPDPTRVQIIQPAVPTSGIVIRLTGRQRITQLTQAETLVLTETTEVTNPDAGTNPVTELLLTVAERNLEKWLRPKDVPSAPLGVTETQAPPGMTRRDRLAMLTVYELELKRLLRTQTPKVRRPIRNPMP